MSYNHNLDETARNAHTILRLAQAVGFDPLDPPWRWDGTILYSARDKTLAFAPEPPSCDPNRYNPNGDIVRALRALTAAQTPAKGQPTNQTPKSPHAGSQEPRNGV